MGNMRFDKEDFKEQIKSNIKDLYRKTIDEADSMQIYQALAYTVKDYIIDNWMEMQKNIDKKDPKIVYYMSMEFLIGRALGNNLINLCIYDEVKEALDELGFDLNALEDEEMDPALGNGGLGRLAACFLDSLSTLGYVAYGCGIRYHYGMFKQKIENGYQVETPDNWLKNGYPFELRRHEYTKEVKFFGHIHTYQKDGQTVYEHRDYSSVNAVPYDIPILGYNNNAVNTLRIWDAEAIDVFSLDMFDKGDYKRAVEQENLAKTITDVLYPNDNHIAGKELRLKQQYFFVSASLQTAIEKFKKTHDNIKDLPNKVTFQMNDTHPTLTVPELMRILMDDEHLSWDEAWAITIKACAYTNHTIMAEALEKWPIDLFKRLLPRIYMIVEEINRRFELDIEKSYPNDKNKKRNLSILYDGQVRMAYLAIVGGYSVNGVAALHTEILKREALKDFYDMMPEKFSNKTNGITQRRFIAHANPLLAKWLDKKIGKEWITDLSKLSKLNDYADDESSQMEFLEIKRANKLRLAKYIKEHNNIDVNIDSIFDIHCKRLHEYKRQLMNILHVIYLYDKLKQNPSMTFTKRTFIFGAKAAAGYKRAKLTIKLINAVADVINNDSSVSDRLKVVFIEDYKVSNAELLFAAADVSEQISTASKEASGTGNMKFMANGAITIGTMDGANVEMYEELGHSDMFVFGMSDKEVIAHENKRDYNAIDIYNSDSDIKLLLLQLIGTTFSRENPELFRDIYNSLIYDSGNDKADRYFILKDFRSYAKAQEDIGNAYADKKLWAKMAIHNIASSGKFSSDRTIQEYVDGIWHLDKIN